MRQTESLHENTGGRELPDPTAPSSARALPDAASSRPLLRRFGRSIEQRAKRDAMRVIRRLAAEPAPIRLEELGSEPRILLVRPNFRIGNAAISTALIAAFRTRFPKARIDFLGTDRTESLLLHQPVDVIYTLSRRDLRRPWRYLSLLRVLRGNQYDLAVQPTSGSLTNDLVIPLLRARYTMGRTRDDRRLYHLEVAGREDHAYDNASVFASALGSSCPDRPVIHLSGAERREAMDELRTFPGMAHDGRFCALFVGGHASKRWSKYNWRALIRILEANAQRFIVFFGPEEAEIGEWLREQTADYRHGIVIEPRPLRNFCALLSFAQCLVTPDSGPMHLAAGLGVPVIVLIKAPVSLRYAPRGARDLALIDPDPIQVHEALTASLTGGA